MQDEPDTTALDAQLQLLVDAHQVPEARALLAATPGGERSPWAQMLALPKVTMLPATPGRDDFHVNMEWARAHRAEFVGQWLALRDGGLLDHDADFGGLTRRLRVAGHEGVLLVLVPG